MSKLETEYQQVAKKINAKIKEAAKAMKEANAIAAKAGVSLTYDEYGDQDMPEDMPEDFMDEISIYPLFAELDKAGWRTSSIGC